MEIQKTSLENFMPEFSTTQDLLQKAMGSNPTDTNAAPTNTPVEAPVLKTTEEILKGLENPQPQQTQSQPEPPKAEGKEPEAPKEEGTASQEADASAKKSGRPSNKLPEGFADIIKTAEEKGKLIGFEDGSYNTVDDFLELIDANFDARKDEFREEAKQEIFQSLSPAMKAVFEYAKLGVQEPQQLIPFLTAVDNLQFTSQLDANNPDHHEVIVRNALKIQGLSDDLIESEIKELSEMEGKLAKRAATLKPSLDNYNRKQIEKMYAEQMEEQRKEQQYWAEHQKAVKQKILDNPTVSGLKLKKEHKQLAYAALAQPDPSLGGLGIYAVVDSLIEKGDFETLTEMILVGLDKKSYYSYLGSGLLESHAQNTQRALRTNMKNTPVEVPAEEGKKLQRRIKSTLSLND